MQALNLCPLEPGSWKLELKNVTSLGSLCWTRGDGHCVVRHRPRKVFTSWPSMEVSDLSLAPLVNSSSTLQVEFAFSSSPHPPPFLSSSSFSPTLPVYSSSTSASSLAVQLSSTSPSTLAVQLSSTSTLNLSSADPHGLAPDSSRPVPLNPSNHALFTPPLFPFLPSPFNPPNYPFFWPSSPWLPQPTLVYPSLLSPPLPFPPNSKPGVHFPLTPRSSRTEIAGTQSSNESELKDLRQRKAQLERQVLTHQRLLKKEENTFRRGIKRVYNELEKSNMQNTEIYSYLTQLVEKESVESFDRFQSIPKSSELNAEPNSSDVDVVEHELNTPISPQDFVPRKKSSAGRYCTPAFAISNVSKKPFRVLVVSIQNQFTMPKLQTRHMKQEEKEKLVLRHFRVMRGTDGTFYFAAKDVCLLIHVRAGNVAKQVGQLDESEKRRMPVECPRRDGTSSTHSLIVLTVKGVRRVLQRCRSSRAIFVLKWFEKTLEELEGKVSSEKSLL